jgi:hypothetical protein
MRLNGQVVAVPAKPTARATPDLRQVLLVEPVGAAIDRPTE